MTSDAFNARKGRGRPKGAPNKVTRALKTMAQEYTERGVRALGQIAFDKVAVKVNGRRKMVPAHPTDDRLRAIGMLLDRAHGKPAIAFAGPLADLALVAWPYALGLLGGGFAALVIGTGMWTHWRRYRRVMSCFQGKWPVLPRGVS